MHSIEIERLIMLRLATFPQFDKARTARDNQNFTPPATGIWMRIAIRGGINMMKGMADMPCTRENGLLMIQVFDRENSGTGNLKAFTDNLADHFAYYQAGKLELLVPSVTNIGTTFTEGSTAATSGFYQMNISVPYRYN